MNGRPVSNSHPMDERQAGINCKDGSITWLSCFNISNLISITGWEHIHICVDITDIVNAREELYNQLDFIQTLIDTIPNPIFVKDKTGRFVNCNKAFEEYTGKNRGEIIGQSAAELSECIDLWDYYLSGHI